MGKPGKTKGALYEENNWFSLGGRLSGSDACDGAGGVVSCGGYRDKVRVGEWTHGLQKGLQTG